jgi:predicted transposase YbfD/YdcC
VKKKEEYYKDICFEHGRRETREYYVENDISWRKERHPGWKGLNGIGACVSTVEEKGNTTTAISYSIYSRAGMQAEEYGKNQRAHWGIENSLRWMLDIGFREDESRMRSENAAENVNVLRHIRTNLLHQSTST